MGELAAVLKVDRIEDPATRLFRLLDTSEASLREVIVGAIANAKRQLGTLEELADLIEAGRIEEAITRASQIIGTRTGDQVVATFTDAGSRAVAVVEGQLDLVIGFDQTNERAVTVMRENRLRLIREFTREQRFATRSALVDGIARGANPREQARDFRQSIGLTQRQQDAVSNYRRLLMRTSEGDSAALTRELRDRRFDRTVRRAAATRAPLTSAQVDRMVGRYAERYIRYRSEVIARTEALSAVHAGNEEAYSQAVDQGAFTAEEVVRIWSTRLDGRERASHNTANGQQVPLGQPFIVGGAALRYPGDRLGPAREIIQCRCAVATRVITPEFNFQ